LAIHRGNPFLTTPQEGQGSPRFGGLYEYFRASTDEQLAGAGGIKLRSSGACFRFFAADSRADILRGWDTRALEFLHFRFNHCGSTTLVPPPRFNHCGYTTPVQPLWFHHPRR
jgi:hypothetical protein